MATPRYQDVYVLRRRAEREDEKSQMTFFITRVTTPGSGRGNYAEKCVLQDKYKRDVMHLSLR